MPGSIASTRFSPSGAASRRWRRFSFYAAGDQVILDNLADALEHRSRVQLHVHPQDTLLLAALDRKVAVGRDFGYGLLELVVLLELRRLGWLWLRHFAHKHAAPREGVPHQAAYLGVVGHPFRDDVARALEVLRGLTRNLRVADSAGEYRVGEGLEPLLLCDHRARAALRLVRLVEVLQGRLGLASLYLRLEGWGELALLVDRLEDRGAPLLELRVVRKPVADLCYLDFVEIAVRLLAVARNERNRAALREELCYSGGACNADTCICRGLCDKPDTNRVFCHDLEPVPFSFKLLASRC